jgi:multimeric flavodoxin WrbA
MKVIAFNGSPRKGGNTHIAIETVFEELNKKNIETEEVYLHDYEIKSCTACYTCLKTKDCKCILDDDFNPLLHRLLEHDGLILASPVYAWNATGQMRCFLERYGFVTMYSPCNMKRKVGAALTVYTRAGGLPTWYNLIGLLLGFGMVVPGSTYATMAQGASPGAILECEWGLDSFRELGQNMAWLLEKLQ